MAPQLPPPSLRQNRQCRSRFLGSSLGLNQYRSRHSCWHSRDRCGLARGIELAAAIADHSPQVPPEHLQIVKGRQRERERWMEAGRWRPALCLSKPVQTGLGASGGSAAGFESLREQSAGLQMATVTIFFPPFRTPAV